VLEIIIPVAIVAFLIVLAIIFRDEVKAKFSKLFKKSDKNKKSKFVKPADKPKEVKEEIKVEDFVPKYNMGEFEERDPSLTEIFGDEFDNDLFEPEPEMPTDFDLNKIENDLFKPINSKRKNKPISQQIKDLPNEIKVMLLDGALKKRDDV